MMVKTRKHAFVVTLGIMVLSLANNIDAQSKDAETTLDELLSTDKNHGLRWFPRAKLARSIAQDQTLSPKIRVDVLAAVLERV